jgi:hypothetical protein
MRVSGRSCRRTQPVDWIRVAAWTARLAADDLESVKQGYRAAGADSPEIIWGPSVEQMQTRPLRFLSEFWSAHRDAGGLPHHDRINPFALQPALGYLMLLDIVDGGMDFRYRLYGSRIANISGFDMTGRLMSEHPASAYVVEFNLAATRAALRRRASLYTTRIPHDALETKTWPRLALPFGGDDGSVARFLVGTVAIRADGSLV